MLTAGWATKWRQDAASDEPAEHSGREAAQQHPSLSSSRRARLDILTMPNAALLDGIERVLATNSNGNVASTTPAPAP
jgi:hypothetical protein